MTEQELTAMEKRAKAHQGWVCQCGDDCEGITARDRRLLVAEVRRLRAELGMHYGHDYAKANPAYTGPCPLCQREGAA